MKNDIVGGVDSEATLHDARVLYRELSRDLATALASLGDTGEKPSDLARRITSHSAALNRLLDIEVNLETRANKLSGALSGAELDLDSAHREVVERLARLRPEG